MAGKQFDKYAMKDGKTPLAESYFNPIWQDIDNRIVAVEDIGERADSAVNDLVTAGLSRLDTYLAPAYENIANLAELGFLTATLQGNAPVTFTLGAKTVILKEGPERDLFRAAPYVTFQPESDYLKVAVAQTVSYDRETGALDVEFLYFSDELAAAPGPHTGIFVSAAAGSTMATIGAVYAAQDAIEAAATLAGFIGAYAPGSYPTTRLNGSPLVLGDIIYDTSAKYLKAWDGDSFEMAVGFSGSRTYRGVFGASPTGVIAVSTDIIDASAFVNGAALRLGVDYTFTANSGSVTVTSPVAGDEYLIIASYRELPSDVAAQAAAALASATAAAGSATAASGSATAASASAAAALASKTATDAALAAASSGPVVSINGQGGVISGIATTADVAAAVAGKANQSTTYTKSEVDAAVGSKADGVFSAVAQGTIGDKAIVVLRSDGKVEVVTGTETLASVGPINTDINDGVTYTGSNAVSVGASAYNATSGKVAVLYLRQTTGTTVYIRIGTVSGQTITFGAETATGFTTTNYSMQVVFNAAGTTVVVACDNFSTPNYRMQLRCGSISGTTVTFGSIVNGDNSTTNYYGRVMDMYHDNIHGSRVVIAGGPDPGWGAQGYLVAATYSGTTLTLGARADLGFVAVVSDYDSANGRIIVGGIDVGWSTTKVWYVRAATISGTTISLGNTVSQAYGATVIPIKSIAWDAANNRAVLVYQETSTCGVRLFVASGATLTSYALVSVPNGAATDSYTMAFDPASARFVLIQTRSGTQSGGIAAYLCSISGTTLSLGPPTTVTENFASVLFVAATTSGSIAVAYSDLDDFRRAKLRTFKIVSGALVEIDFTIISSAELSQGLTWVASILRASFDQASGALFWVGALYSADQNNISRNFMLTIPSESTNADAWIGQAVGSFTDGQTAKIKARGQIADGFTGLTVGSDVFLRGDGALVTTNNGRPFGRAIAADKALMRTV